MFVFLDPTRVALHDFPSKIIPVYLILSLSAPTHLMHRLKQVVFWARFLLIGCRRMNKRFEQQVGGASVTGLRS